jgi:hypothetical protein
MRREMTDHDVVGLGYCDVCGVAGPRCCAALAAAKAARREGERALEEERRMRVQLSDDSQRHLDRALAAEAALAQAREALRRAGERTHSALGGRHAFFTFEATDTVEACPEYECVEARRALLAPPDKETTNG